MKNQACIDILFNICNTCFRTGQGPTAWNKSIITPIPKDHSKDQRVPLNYRGIALISTPCKIYCDILNNRMSKYLEENNIIVDEQNGHRQKRSCVDHLYTLNSIVQNRLNSKQSTYVCFVDIRKAFDHVNRNSLWYKANRCGINGRMLAAVKSLYHDVSYAVKVNGQLTDWFKVHNGVTQGCVLSCSLFQIYLNDLAIGINRLNCGVQVNGRNIGILMFADDIALITKNEVDLQRMLDYLNRWCKEWKLSINGEKSKVIHFRNKGKLQSNHLFQCGDLNIDYTEQYKYLGLWFQENLDYDYGVQQLSKSASRALGALISKYYSTGGMEYSVFTKLYELLIVPILMYGSAVWGFKKYKWLNSVQMRAAKVFLGLGKRAPNNAVIGDLGWSSCFVRQLGEIYRMRIRLNNMDNSRVNKHVYKWSKSHGKSNERKFDKQMIKMNININYTIASGSSKQAVKDLVKHINAFEQNEWYVQLWNDKGNEVNGNKLRMYRLHKERIGLESYVTTSMPKECRKAIAKLRSGTMALYVETGRYSKTPLSERICTYCQSGQVEDEKHFLLKCELYNDIRYDLLNEAAQLELDFMNENCVSQYCLLMNTESIQTFLGKTLVKMYNRCKAFTS